MPLAAPELRMPWLPVLTPVAVVVGVHEGQPQPLVLLQRALVREAPVDGAHHVRLLVAVIDGRFGHVDGFAAEGWKGRSGGEPSWTGRAARSPNQ